MKIISLKDIINDLSKNDIIKILSLLSQLTNVYNDEDELKYMINQFQKSIKQLDSNINIFLIFIDNKISGIGTLIIEQKIIHGFGKVGHIEDIVIDKEMIGKGIGKKFLEFLNFKARSFNCYKVILNCSDNLITFYKKC